MTELSEHYASLTDDELRDIAANRELTSSACLILSQELARRGIGDVPQYREQLEREDAMRRDMLSQKLAVKERRHRIGIRATIVVSALMFLAGAGRLFIEGNERDGVGIMIATPVVLLVGLVGLYVRRLLWRVLLRP